MVDYKDIGRRIRAVRIEKGMTQANLAEATGVGVTHISHVETGNGIPSLQTFLDIVNALNCSADELLFGITADEREKKLLDYFRNSDESGQDLLLKTGDTVSKLASKEKGSLNETG